ncbi:MAG: NAD-glutamate dehydrogenase, partial [Actinobacteria bacterium]|nr:NAD-glutamate dehydrogenase [Actinomycetota bacterium]
MPSLCGQVSLVREVAARRAPGTSKVVIERDDDGLATVAAIVTDDMPFLVDSVTAALTEEGRVIRLVMHPQLVVERDSEGNLLGILDLEVDDPRPEGAVAESWMCFRMDRDFAHESDSRLVEHLERVLRDVRAAVDDWQAMVAQALQIARELRAVPPVSVPDVEVRESADLLEWLCDDHLTFVGYREYRLVTDPDGAEALQAVADSGLGILRAEPIPGRAIDHPSRPSSSFAILPPAVRARARDPRILVLSKANSRSTVHRPSYLDYVGVKVFDGAGQVIGERRFLGLLTASAYNESVTEIPVLRELVHRVTDSLGLVPGSHSAKDLRQFLETYPRDELFQTQPEQLIEIASSVMHLLERRQTKLYLRVDDYGRFVSCIVYLPRDRYTTPVRLRVERLLREALGGVSVDYTALVTESVLARLHYVVRVAPGADVPPIDHAVLEARLAQATLSWEDLFTEATVAALGEARASTFLAIYAAAFPEGYKEEFPAPVAVNDALTIERLEPSELALDWYAHDGDDADRMRFKVIRIGSAMSLSRILPTLQVMGVEVLDEHPHVIDRAKGAPAWILDFGLRLPAGDLEERASLPLRATDAFRASWFGECETDAFNALVVRAGLTWRQTSLIRAYSRYLRQVGSSFGQEYIQQVMTGDASIVRLLVHLFETQFDPDLHTDDDAGRTIAAEAIVDQIERELERVLSLDHDRIFRAFLAAIRATLRTNYFAQDRGPRQALAFKIDPRAIPDMPLPRPMFEIWAYSPRVEGVHMRFGTVARGGLRWSDRPEDFRTEVLGLVKAQEVKNAVIVPVGAKGGFFARELPDPAVDREAWLTEGKAAYREFVSALLDVTDNRVAGGIVAPRGVLRRDGDDSYLVVAADKGTATFSDLANEISAEYGFWLGDAFASGGSVGYDHKAMGITARGAWESVKRHFRDLGTDTQAESFTVVGVGDMSGDVFGNGMLLSEGIRLVAAFDHRDIFIDPEPDPASSFRERARLFGLPRSSWADYDGALISPGGGVFSRAAKAIE